MPVPIRNSFGHKSSSRSNASLISEIAASNSQSTVPERCCLRAAQPLIASLPIDLAALPLFISAGRVSRGKEQCVKNTHRECAERRRSEDLSVVMGAPP